MNAKTKAEIDAILAEQGPTRAQIDGWTMQVRIALVEVTRPLTQCSVKSRARLLVALDSALEEHYEKCNFPAEIPPRQCPEDSHVLGVSTIGIPPGQFEVTVIRDPDGQTNVYLVQKTFRDNPTRGASAEDAGIAA